MNELLNYKRRLSVLGLCQEYTQKWADCKTKEDLVKMATDTNGAQTMCDAHAFGYGMPLDYIQKEFADYINGKNIIDHGGYTSMLFVGYNGTINAQSTLIIILGGDCEVVIPENRICRIFVAKAKVHIICHGACEVEQYTDTTSSLADLTLDGENKDQIIINQNLKSEWKK